jgi:hypothetical protein
VPIKSISMDDKMAFFDQLRFENHQALGDHKVVDSRWYRKYRDGQKDGSLIAKLRKEQMLS